MIKTTWQFCLENAIPLILGILVVGAAIVSLDPAREAGASLYSLIYPVTSEWTVTEAKQEGQTLVLRGTMIKHRDCVFVPPTIARDQTGWNYAVLSASQAPGQTWAASSEPQKWGPWYIHGGVGKDLTFFNLYLCGQSRPNMVLLGMYPEPKLKTK